MLTWNDRAELERRWFPDAQKQLWGRFRSELAAHVTPETLVLDAGGGQGSWFLRSLVGQARQVIGVDTQRPAHHILDAFVQGTLEALPFPDGTFHVIVCNDVIEHLVHPYQSMAEVARVLSPPSRRGAKDGGLFFFKTPCLYAPSSLLTHLFPYVWHRRVKRLLGVPVDHVFPTAFRCNTPSSLDACLREAGMEPEWLLRVDGTFGYFAFNRPLYVLGLLYSRFLSLPPFRPFRSVLVGVYRRAR